MRCFDNQITLTDVTGQPRKSADIVVHYVPHAGGVVFAGYAICGANGCGNIIVSSEFATEEGYTPEYLFYVTLHELGHALGLGHATNLTESMDLMGYEWIGSAPDPVFSQCDLDALAYLFGPLLAGEDPAGPGPSQLESTSTVQEPDEAWPCSGVAPLAHRAGPETGTPRAACSARGASW